MDYAAFCDELTKIASYELVKIAFDPRDALKMLRAAKKHQVRAGGRVGLGYGVVPSSKATEKMTSGVVGELTSRGVEEPIARKAVGSLKKQQATVMGMNPEEWAGKKSIIVSPERGDAKRWLAEKGLPHKRIQTPEQRLMAEGLIKGHEMAERAAVKAPKVSFRGVGHLSPEVILKEHNMLVTMPKALRKKVAPSTQAMRKMQGESEALRQVTGGGFRFGKSQRLSRHARKRVTELMEKEVQPQIQEGYQQLSSLAPTLAMNA